MITTKEEYKKRLSEVELYFKTIQLLDNGQCSIVCKDISGNVSTNDIDQELSKILKANGFLLLYNLIEATVRNSIVAIFNSITADKLTYKCLSENLKKLWVRQEIKEIRDFNQSKNKIFEISEKVLNDSLLDFKIECVNISGNIDAQSIRDIAKQFGYAETSNGRDLLTIKEKRNKLAHGEFTFSEIGKEYTVGDLIKLKTDTVSYIEDVLKNVENFILDKKYKRV